MELKQWDMVRKLVWVLPLCLFTFLPSAAQSWASKAAKSVFTLKTFDQSGNLLGSANGFFVSEEGDAVSCFTPFAGAVRAVVIDASGKELPVEYMLGANEMYDVAKFRVSGKKLQPLTLASMNAATGQQAWLLPYSVKKPTPVNGQVDKAETFQEQYAYYTVKMQMPDNCVGCPLLNDNGEAIGLMQQPAQQGADQSYAISVRFITDMKISGLSLNDAALQKTKIKMAMPDAQDEATLMMMMAATTMDSIGYAGVINDFIAKFPNAEEGYINRAQLAFNGLNFAAAAADMQQAISISDPKDNAHFAYARMIYQKEVYASDVPFAEWSLDKAAQEVKSACDINPMPAYQHLLAQILFAQKKYDEALSLFKQLDNTNLKGAEIYYETARCYEMKGDTVQMLALLDSAVNVYSKPYLKEVAPYLLARATARMDAGKNRLAVQDLNEYENLNPTGLNANFYYLREQAEVAGRQFQQALNDITKATEMEPNEAIYHAEKSSLESRVGMYDEAIKSARECIRLAPGESDGYLLLGLALCQKGNKAEGLPQLQKAKDMGNAQADALIARYR